MVSVSARDIIWVDEFTYVYEMRYIAEGHLYALTRLYSHFKYVFTLFYALMLKPFEITIRTGRILSIILSTIIIITSFLTASRISNKREAALASLLISLNPVIFFMTIFMMPDVLCLVFYSIAIYYAIKWATSEGERDRRALMVSVLASVFSALSKDITIPAVLALLLCVIIVEWRRIRNISLYLKKLVECKPGYYLALILISSLIVLSFMLDPDRLMECFKCMHFWILNPCYFISPFLLSSSIAGLLILYKNRKLSTLILTAPVVLEFVTLITYVNIIAPLLGLKPLVGLHARHTMFLLPPIIMPSSTAILRKLSTKEVTAFAVSYIVLRFISTLSPAYWLWVPGIGGVNFPLLELNDVMATIFIVTKISSILRGLVTVPGSIHGRESWHDVSICILLVFLASSSVLLMNMYFISAIDRFDGLDELLRLTGEWIVKNVEAGSVVMTNAFYELPYYMGYGVKLEFYGEEQPYYVDIPYYVVSLDKNISIIAPPPTLEEFYMMLINESFDYFVLVWHPLIRRYPYMADFLSAPPLLCSEEDSIVISDRMSARIFKRLREVKELTIIREAETCDERGPNTFLVSLPDGGAALRLATGGWGRWKIIFPLVLNKTWHIYARVFTYSPGRRELILEIDGVSYNITYITTERDIFNMIYLWNGTISEPQVTITIYNMGPLWIDVDYILLKAEL